MDSKRISFVQLPLTGGNVTVVCCQPGVGDYARRRLFPSFYVSGDASGGYFYLIARCLQPGCLANKILQFM